MDEFTDEELELIREWYYQYESYDVVESEKSLNIVNKIEAKISARKGW